MESALAERIKDRLAGRDLPIRLDSGQKIIGIETFARAEARSALHPSEAISRPARERLARLGIDVDERSGVFAGR
jgi:hypothetical protein